ncbi:MAG: hypothetical protein HC850_12610, partial [Rhodomicrobium sp.]|nr:hypothetical protein [Rhodomicrobium sp.]
MPRYLVPPAANDEGKAPAVMVEGLDAPPLCVAEVEIFDALISTDTDPRLANDNDRRREWRNARDARHPVRSRLDA